MSDTAPSTQQQPTTPAQPQTTPSAIDAAIAANDVVAYRAARRAERSGTAATDSPIDSTDTAASSAAQPADQAASTDATTAPDSDPGTPGDRAGKGKGVNERNKQLGAEIQELQERLKLRRQLREELAQLDVAGARTRDEKAAESSTATGAKPATFPEYEQYLQAHPDATFGQWMDARDTWRDQQRAAADRQQRAQEADRARATQWQERLTQARTADPAFDAKVDPATPMSAPMKALVADSDVGPQLLVYLSEHQDIAMRLAQSHPAQVLREMGALEAQLRRTADAGATSPTKPHVKTVSDAPAPPTTLGTRPTTPLDAVDQAVVAGDVRAYRAARRRERTSHLR